MPRKKPADPVKAAREALKDVRHQRFCEEFVLGTAGGKAYENAGFETDGRSAQACASRLLTRANVKAYIKALRDADASKKIATRSERMEALTRIGAKQEDRAPTVSIQAIREMNKMTGEYKDGAGGNSGEEDFTLWQLVTGKRKA